jgi:hypothetical protein
LAYRSSSKHARCIDDRNDTSARELLAIHTLDQHTLVALSAAEPQSFLRIFPCQMSRRTYDSPSRSRRVLAAVAAAASVADYDVVEEEILETLSDEDITSALRLSPRSRRPKKSVRTVEVEEEIIEDEYIEVEVIDAPRSSRKNRVVRSDDGQEPLVETDVEEEEDDDVEEEVIYDYDSGTEVEIITDDDDAIASPSPRSPKGKITTSSSSNRPKAVSSSQDEDDVNDESLFEEILEDEDDILIDDYDEYVEEEVISHHRHYQDDSEVEEVTLREDDLLLNESFNQSFNRSCQLREIPAFHGSGLSAKYNPYMGKSRTTDDSSNSRVDYDDDDGGEDQESSEEEDDGVSAEELTEAIEYVLRQERAVAKFILTEEQAEKMAHLPVKVMKIIVDHLESCDNDNTPIDWDFMLKIVLPFCDSEKAEEDDETNHDANANRLVCVEIGHAP